ASIQKLGSPKFSDRESATEELKQAGEAALTSLQEAVRTNQDPEIRRRADSVRMAILDNLATRLLREGIREEEIEKDYKKATRTLERAIHFAEEKLDSKGTLPESVSVLAEAY